MIRMPFTKHARWYVGVTAAVGTEGRLRAAVFILTPRQRRFIEFRRYRRPAQRREQCLRTVLQMFEDERWHRRPRKIICRDRTLAADLREMMDGVCVRTNRNQRKFATADRIFAEHVETTRRRTVWCTAGHVVLRK